MESTPIRKILINICSHGNETIGLRVRELIEYIPFISGTVVFNIGNPLALEKNVRFVESDLNRSFPGNEDGTYEEIRACELMHIIPNFDLVIDVHSTVSGIKDCLIIEDNGETVQSMIGVCRHAKTVLHMNATKGQSIFTATRLVDRTIPAIAFEYGDNSEESAQKTTSDIMNIFKLLGLCVGEVVSNNHNPSQFDCYALYEKEESDMPNMEIKNYEFLPKGSVIGYKNDGSKIYSDEDFYPVLFGETNYQTYFGFKARKLV